jgi:hypothetical protein
LDIAGPFHIAVPLWNHDLKKKELLRIPLVRDNSLQLVCCLFDKPVSDGAGRHIIRMRREGD